ncbi:hypothetical protein OPKNFCMD_1309 [Methylobacterium crusticola]|uniref:Cytochrome c domain-containing protein n=1 Tax=Methylobacterium crusticola TaxID=1697972 RepID=A0ABQ4QTD2_9HYPH|nr:PQQ-dependent sugar dehydrogenase [Methylobacterium crusticola]GJD48586.1 hypothetical protein OPKNFCMD_1309 [Methylobacterium crusticola]
MRSGVNTAPPWQLVAAWYTAVAGLLLILPHWQLGFPIWQLPRLQWLPFGCLAAAFLASAGITTLVPPVSPRRGLWRNAVAITAIFSLVFLGFYVTRTTYSRAITLTVFAAAVALLPAPYLVRTSRSLRVAVRAALVVAAISTPLALSFARYVTQHTAALIKTEYYNLDVDIYAGVFPRSVIRGGALARIGDRYLLLTADGDLHAFAWDPGTEHLKVTPLPYRVPINGEAFAAAAGRPWAEAAPEDQPREEHKTAAGREPLSTDAFRTYSLLVQEIGSEARVLVSHAYWHAARECWVERVSMLQADRAAFLRGAAAGGWRTLYETAPCLPIRGAHSRRGRPFVGYFGGGRMALLDAGTLLLTVGDFGFDGVASDVAQAQEPATSYGKTLAISLEDGRATLHTLGHRNPQGLYVDHAGTIWSTEHGPQGGDELNRLVAGTNYGWPYATDGTDYGSFSWPLNKPRPEPGEYQPPVFAWVPSIGVSNVIGVERGLFPQWRGDLLIASLKAQTLFRARLRDGQVAYLEPIAIGRGIRDLVEGHDGRIILWTTDGSLVSLRPKEGATGEGLFAEKCSGCHQSVRVSGPRIGPPLRGVVGRPVASVRDYPDYSPALRQLGGVWTEERLDAFLRAPRVASPGTTMEFAGAVSAQERAAVIGYLGTLR